MAGLSMTHGDYTVGWICSLPVEQAAARLLLDEEHPRLPLICGDSNRYCFGSIGGHNIAIACLPDGETSTDPSATVATRMINSFPLLRFCLIVGIRGGVPSSPNCDIRLGDVLVSRAASNAADVIQSDRGRVLESNFTQAGSLKKPPEVLKQAVANLRATHKLKHNKHPTQIASAYDTFTSPTTILGSQETIFRSDYKHPEGSHFSTCESCDATQIIQRLPRSPNPVFHYGLVASGNQDIRNVVKRVQISKEFSDVLCFEMEAAGLMNDFPCVIRGICDYSHSHKTKAWQEYAAFTAAAYAKELHGEIVRVDQYSDTPGGQASAGLMNQLTLATTDNPPTPYGMAYANPRESGYFRNMKAIGTSESTRCSYKNTQFWSSKGQNPRDGASEARDTPQDRHLLEMNLCRVGGCSFPSWKQEQGWNSIDKRGAISAFAHFACLVLGHTSWFFMAVAFFLAELEPPSETVKHITKVGEILSVITHSDPPYSNCLQSIALPLFLGSAIAYTGIILTLYSTSLQTDTLATVGGLSIVLGGMFWCSIGVTAAELFLVFLPFSVNLGFTFTIVRECLLGKPKMVVSHAFVEKKDLLLGL